MSLVDSLLEHERAWNQRPLLRRIYREWFALLTSRLSDVDGATIELGSGIGQLRAFVPELVTTDVEATPWAERVVDAEALPYEDGALANIVMLDVFHHLPRPAVFLDEATRALAIGGRVVMLEPYVSPLSAVAYRLHHERLELDADGFAESDSPDPLDANLAQTTLAFFRQRGEYERRWPLVVAFVAFGVLYPALRPQVDEARDRGVTARATQRVNDWVESHLSGDQVALTFLESDDSRTFALVGHYADVPPRRYRFLPATNEGVAYANEKGLDVRYVITAAPTDPSALTSSLGLAGSAVPIDAPGFVYRVAP